MAEYKKSYEELDRSVYKASEQCLGMIGCQKLENDKRVLIPITHSDNLEIFLVQNTENCTLLKLSKDDKLKKKSKKAKKENDEIIELNSETAIETIALSENKVVQWLAEHFNINAGGIQIDKIVPSTLGFGYTIPTIIRACPFKKGDHHNNHLYIVVKLDHNYVNIELFLYIQQYLMSSTFYHSPILE